MSQPPAYARAFSFTDWTTNHPDDQQPGVSLDNEFEAIEVTTNAIRANLAQIQRDDGALANNSVGPDQLAADLVIGLRSVSDWETGEDYIALDAVWYEYKLYRCLESHTAAAAFATDLAAEKWELILDVQTYAEAIAQSAAQAAVTQAVIDALSEDPDLTALLAGKAGLSSTQTFTGANTFSGAFTASGSALFSGAATFNQSVSLLGGFTCSIGTATSQADYWVAQPTDYAVGKPRAVLRKTTTAGNWELKLEDANGAAGQLNLVASTLLLNGSAPWTAANFDPDDKLDVADLPDSLTETEVARIATRRALVF